MGPAWRPSARTPRSPSSSGPLERAEADDRRAEALAATAAALEDRERDVAERLRLALEREAATEAFRATRRFRLATALARPGPRATAAAPAR